MTRALADLRPGRFTSGQTLTGPTLSRHPAVQAVIDLIALFFALFFLCVVATAIGAVLFIGYLLSPLSS